MNLPILTHAQQQLTALFEQWIAMMREALTRPVSDKPSARTKSPSLGGVGEATRRPTLPDVERALRAKYHLRYNVLTGRTEYRAVDAADDVSYLPEALRHLYTDSFDLTAEGQCERKHHERRVYEVKMKIANE